MNATSKITPVTGQALRKVFQLLEDNFDPVAGQYRNGFDDLKIAKDTGISTTAVKDYRTSAFGKIKPPSELAQAKQDVEELETLFLKTETEFRAQLKDLKVRIGALQRRFD